MSPVRDGLNLRDAPATLLCTQREDLIAVPDCLPVAHRNLHGFFKRPSGEQLSRDEAAPHATKRSLRRVYEIQREAHTVSVEAKRAGRQVACVHRAAERGAVDHDVRDEERARLLHAGILVVRNPRPQHVVGAVVGRRRDGRAVGAKLGQLLVKVKREDVRKRDPDARGDPAQLRHEERVEPLVRLGECLKCACTRSVLAHPLDQEGVALAREAPARGFGEGGPHLAAEALMLGRGGAILAAEDGAKHGSHLRLRRATMQGGGGRGRRQPAQEELCGGQEERPGGVH
mmetsp:Transcript_22885/g.58122  ORF Transcript_22885/g.58122 Transcript_22885/m.58122 type:complete len:287 (-) Transcript_22885:15-875(-)|eukprot:CAMPEP_0179918884 /NCGR_PEP_ID=MMETSP0983-20121128/3622_1 /TAXON_ID=483367 /ORGANISM="non described non described, Strain CCMP 2436" /LENGTH=286 /DNA_ID=CAMNT_0021821751 /DNA_START=502 /DNA_END=1362 /DNA_ORIENTATION=-